MNKWAFCKANRHFVLLCLSFLGKWPNGESIIYVSVFLKETLLGTGMSTFFSATCK